MSQTIRMDTEIAHATSKLLQSNVARFDSVIDELTVSVNRLHAGWNGGRSDSFCSQLQSLRKQLERKAWELTNLAQRLQHEVDEWEAADRILTGETSKNANVVFSSATIAGATGVAGQVLGAFISNLKELSWKDKFELERRLTNQINEIEGKYTSEEEISKRITEIEKEIMKLEKERIKALNKADNIINKILPDFPFEADSEDGVPWRVKADDYEDQVKQHDERLVILRTEKENLNQYQDLKLQQQELAEIFQNRLRDVSPKNYGSCALYAAARRPDLGSTQSNFEQYTDGAAANYISKYQDTAFQINAETDLRDKVGAGFAVVWEPKNANPTYGHVAIVEEVGKDYVIVSHAGWSEGSPTKIPIAELQKLWLIP